MPFERGKPKTGGRLPGVGNKFTGAFREAVQIVYNGLGGHEAFLDWGRNNQTEFYRIAARLIPGEMQEGGGKNITIIIHRKAKDLTVLPAIEDHSTIDEAEPTDVL